MKRYILYIMVALACVACTNDENVGDGSSVAITFNVQGDFTLSTHDMTRALTADGKDMTDVWVLDYQSGTLVQQLHQSDNTAADFGTPTLDLAMGTHHIYFIASRSQSPTLNTTDHTLSFAKVLDTFYKDYTITISAGTSSGSRSVSLDRVVTKLKVVFEDAIPSDASTFNITPVAWHYGMDYLTGEPTAATASQTVVVNIPGSSLGKTGESVNVYGFSSATEWTTDVTVTCKAANNDVLGSATITDAPFLRNRVSEYTGRLFSDNGSMTLSLNATLDDSYQGTW